jgi:hypothetical protein
MPQQIFSREKGLKRLPFDPRKCLTQRRGARRDWRIGSLRPLRLGELCVRMDRTMHEAELFRIRGIRVIRGE